MDQAGSQCQCFVHYCQGGAVLRMLKYIFKRTLDFFTHILVYSKKIPQPGQFRFCHALAKAVSNYEHLIFTASFSPHCILKFDQM